MLDKLSLAVLSLSVTAWCGTAYAQAVPAAVNQLQICLAHIEGNPRYARIYDKLGVSTAADLRRMPTQRQRSDNEVISAPDISLGLEWHNEVRLCSLPAIEALGTQNPQLQTYFKDREADAANMIADIVSRKITTFAAANARLSVLKEHAQVAGGLLQRAIPPGYVAALAAALEAHKRYPESAQQRREEGVAYVRFRFDRAGNILDYVIVNSTGYPDLDAAVGDMIRATTLPPVPAGMSSRPIFEATVPVQFSMRRPAQ